MILKKILPILFAIFILSFFAISASADNSYSNNDNSSSDVVESDNSSSISFPFTFLGNSYVFSIPFSDNFMPIARDIIFYFLLARSLFTKFKAVPSLISSVPYVAASDNNKK